MDFKRINSNPNTTANTSLDLVSHQLRRCLSRFVVTVQLQKMHPTLSLQRSDYLSFEAGRNAAKYVIDNSDIKHVIHMRPFDDPFLKIPVSKLLIAL